MIIFPNSIGLLKTSYKFIFFPFHNPKSTTFIFFPTAHYTLTQTLGFKPLFRRESKQLVLEVIEALRGLEAC